MAGNTIGEGKYKRARNQSLTLFVISIAFGLLSSLVMFAVRGPVIVFTRSRGNPRHCLLHYGHDVYFGCIPGNFQYQYVWHSARRWRQQVCAVFRCHIYVVFLGAAGMVSRDWYLTGRFGWCTYACVRVIFSNRSLVSSVSFPESGLRT